MARTVLRKPGLETQYRTATGPRTIPLTNPNGVRLPRDISIGRVNVFSRDANSVIFHPSCRFWVDDEVDEPDALWREDYEAMQCFKTSYAYDLIGTEHPRIVPRLDQDAWTGLPILKKPTYGSLLNFFDEYTSKLYTVKAEATSPNDRVRPEFLPLVYQWSLQLLSALVLIHSHKIAYGVFLEESCWISAESLDISLAGFIYSDFRDPEKGWQFRGDFNTGVEFSPESLPPSRMVRDPTLGTDIFMLGTLIYRIMTSYDPGEGMGHGLGETARLMRDEDWLPDLEDEFMGKILHKCWRFEYDAVEELQSGVQALIESYGWSVKGDNLEKLDINHIKTLLQGSITDSEQ
ncbi:Ff.00g135380.m01.CDS01 [Fusarium sp. VM40]|nr:Ff.00g135380.m01.CDS01 [Fusarium sp. VM40]